MSSSPHQPHGSGAKISTHFRDKEISWKGERCVGLPHLSLPMIRRVDIPGKPHHEISAQGKDAHFETHAET